jgi:chemotaxis protein methyltransferase CheR
MLSMTDAEFIELAAYIKKKFGVNLGLEKRNLVHGRLQKIISEHGFLTLREYYEYLLADISGAANVELVNAITTNHTFFMREPSHFDFFSQQVLPFLYQTIHNHDLRVWCAVCSTGEEAYTLAMLIADFFSVKNQLWDTKLLATDISLQALRFAQKGIYSKEEVMNLPRKWQTIYFNEFEEDHYKIKTELQAQVIFRQFNLMDEIFPFKKKFHTIFCRNVMIYFDDKTRRRLVEKFYEYLEPGGYLFIGHSEVIDRNATLFSYVMPSVYRKG